MPRLASPTAAWPFAALLGASMAFIWPYGTLLCGYLVFVAVTDARERVIPARAGTIYAVAGLAVFAPTQAEIDPLSIALNLTLGVLMFAATLLGRSGAGDHRLFFALAVLAAPLPLDFVFTATLVGVLVGVAWGVIAWTRRLPRGIPLGTCLALGYAFVMVALLAVR